MLWILFSLDALGWSGDGNGVLFVKKNLLHFSACVPSNFSLCDPVQPEVATEEKSCWTNSSGMSGSTLMELYGTRQNKTCWDGVEDDIISFLDARVYKKWRKTVRDI